MPNVNNFVIAKKRSLAYDPLMEPKIREFLLDQMAIYGWKKQVDMAEAIGVPRGTLHRWLAGVSLPEFETLKKIAVGLKVPLELVISARNGTYQPLTKIQRDAMVVRKIYGEELIRHFIQEDIDRKRPK